VFRLDDGAFVRLPASVHDLVDLAADATGGLWIGTDDGLWHLPDGGAPVRVAREGALAGQVLEDAGGTVWFSGESEICSASSG
jgi:ligand-binding sensor domain-containing protein